MKENIKKWNGMEKTLELQQFCKINDWVATTSLFERLLFQFYCLVKLQIKSRFYIGPRHTSSFGWTKWTTWWQKRKKIIKTAKRDKSHQKNIKNKKAFIAP